MRIGEIQTLRVARVSEFGLYLADSEGNEVLLPNRYVSLTQKVDDEVEVFVYHDSEVTRQIEEQQAVKQNMKADDLFFGGETWKVE